MSAFVVGRKHVNYLVNAGLLLRRYGPLVWFAHGTTHSLVAGDMEETRRICQMLWDENIMSVMHRYPDCGTDGLPGSIEETSDYSFEFLPEVDPVQVLKACDCYEYQSSEHDDWEQSEAHAFLLALRGVAIGALEGYDQAQWEII